MVKNLHIKRLERNCLRLFENIQLMVTKTLSAVLCKLVKCHFNVDLKFLIQKTRDPSWQTDRQILKSSMMKNTKNLKRWAD
jgi:hypothetical protein